MGYLALRVGEEAEVLHVGTEAGEHGWLFCASRGSCDAPRGWVPADAVVEVCPAEKAEASPLVQVAQGRVLWAWRAVIAPGEGYLSVDFGAAVTVLHVGTKEADELGWLYCKAVSSGARGWLLSEALSAAPPEASISPMLRDGAPVARPMGSKAPEDKPHCPPPRRACPGSEERDPADGQRSPSRLSAAAVASASRLGLDLLGGQAPEDLPWSYPLCDTERRCFVGHLPSQLDKSVLRRFLITAVEETEWQQPVCGFGPLPRSTAWMVRGGCCCPYKYGGVEVTPEPFPRWMEEVMTAVMPLCGLSDPATWPNCCNLNRYSDGSEAVAWHADDERLFQGKVQDCRVISLSLGQERQFEVRRLSDDDSATGVPREEQVTRLRLADGDLCTMEGLTQKYYEHRVPKAARSLRLRVNFTWRWIVEHDRRRCGMR
eukprot:gnl/TRDRNA2_/TRDRNA2_191331_c0_seq1.p1 gnl/TRDRNA2_/TRDRNA2_191331_c0~~gnl/TRDRNA2_/TRDRNA2_191331_c0_seq1.p1  ORF type:complete len:474 (+),score=64.73 gnl/TRDRNA2_/TRDRNA2_191331_c0_seq1:132-1424(+)